MRSVLHPFVFPACGGKVSLRVDVEGDEAHLRQVPRGSSSATFADVSSEELFRIHRGIGEIDFSDSMGGQSSPRDKAALTMKTITTLWPLVAEGATETIVIDPRTGSSRRALIADVIKSLR